MAETSGFFDAEELTDGTFDREYIAEQWANYFKLFIGNGVFINPTNQLKVVAGEGMQVIVKQGWAFINGYWYHNDSDLVIAVPVNSTPSTVNSGVFVQFNSQNRTVTTILANGRTEVDRESPHYELKLAEVSVATGTTAITDSMITDTRPDEDVCGFVKGLVSVVSTDDLFQQFTDMFMTWFEEMKGQLSEDAAGHLQAEIDNITDEIGDGDISEIGDGTVKGAILSLSNAGVVVGSMTIFAGSVVPDGYLLCDGQAVSRMEYADLYAVIGTTWGAGDGSTTFNVPDMREVAPVGIGQSERTEGAHDVFTLGEFKDDQLQEHSHSVSTTGGNHQHSLPRGVAYAGGGSAAAAGSTGFDNAGITNWSGNLSMSGTASTITSGRSGNVTRGKRIGVNYIIKY